MFIELVDVLRCVRPHADSWLVAVAVRTEGRDIIEGALGCPVCGAEYPIAGGVASFDDAEVPSGSPLARGDPDAAMRLAAFLDLTSAGGYVVLGGAWSAHAQSLLEIADVHVLLLNALPGVAIGGGVSAIRATHVLPLAAGSCRGAALDEANARPAMVESASRALRPRGRLLAPAAHPLPEGVSELARDDEWWIGERAQAESRPVRLELARG